MNHILHLTAKVQANKDKMNQIAEEIQQFEAHLHSGKFTGTETVKYVCPRCQWDTYTEERKDWIATTDVLRWLEGFKTLLND